MSGKVEDVCLETTSHEAAAYLNRYRKPALIEMICALVALAEGECDTAPNVEQIEEYVKPVAQARWDPIPKRGASCVDKKDVLALADTFEDLQRALADARSERDHALAQLRSLTAAGPSSPGSASR